MTKPYTYFFKAEEFVRDGRSWFFDMDDRWLVLADVFPEGIRAMYDARLVVERAIFVGFTAARNALKFHLTKQ